MVDFRLSTFLNDIECSIAKYLSILIAAIVKTLAPTETPINKIIFKKPKFKNKNHLYDIHACMCNVYTFRSTLYVYCIHFFLGNRS